MISISSSKKGTAIYAMFVAILATGILFVGIAAVTGYNGSGESNDTKVKGKVIIRESSTANGSNFEDEESSSTFLDDFQVPIIEDEETTTTTLPTPTTIVSIPATNPKASTTTRKPTTPTTRRPRLGTTSTTTQPSGL